MYGVVHSLVNYVRYLLYIQYRGGCSDAEVFLSIGLEYSTHGRGRYLLANQRFQGLRDLLCIFVTWQLELFGGFFLLVKAFFAAAVDMTRTLPLF